MSKALASAEAWGQSSLGCGILSLLGFTCRIWAGRLLQMKGSHCGAQTGEQRSDVNLKGT